MPPRRRLMILIVGVVLVLAIVAVTLIAVRNRDSARADPSKQGPVLLVSGYGGGAQGMSTIASALQAQGRTAVIVPAVGDNTGDIEVQAQNLNEVVKKQLSAGATSVDIVGHSQGGLVARVWANEYGTGIARRIVTLGSPHHGTDVALAASLSAGSACPQACKQLVPGSPLLRDLPETPARADWISIYTGNDQTVTPISTSRLDGAVNIQTQDVCADSKVTHGDLIRDPLTIGLIELAIDGRELKSAPGPAQCASLRADG